VPLVSVIIPCFRQAQFLKEAIESVLLQSHPRVDVVIVDDGSTDNAREIARAFPGVRYLRQRNQGLAAARNAGIGLSAGDYLVFLDADDCLMPRALEAGLDAFHLHGRAGMVAGHHQSMDVRSQFLAPARFDNPGETTFLSLLRKYSLGPPGVMLFRREVIKRLGGFDASVNPAADYALALRVARHYPIWHYEEPVLNYRRHGTNMTGNSAAMLGATMTVLRRQWRHARGSHEGRQAYREGLEHWRQSWGEILVASLAVATSPVDVVHGFWTLLRFDPAGFRNAIRLRRQPSASPS
jgi:glycosyltransferase involved in cell wall biosynthesis